MPGFKRPGSYTLKRTHALRRTVMTVYYLLVRKVCHHSEYCKIQPFFYLIEADFNQTVVEVVNPFHVCIEKVTLHLNRTILLNRDVSSSVENSFQVISPCFGTETFGKFDLYDNIFHKSTSYGSIMCALNVLSADRNYISYQ